MVVHTEERMKILRMLQDGVITAEEASELLAAMESAEAASPTRRPRWLRIRVTDTDKNKPRVNLTLPVSLVKAGLKMGARFTPELDRLDAAQVEQLLMSSGVGHIVDVIDDEDGEHVEIYLD